MVILVSPFSNTKVQMEEIVQMDVLVLQNVKEVFIF